MIAEYLTLVRPLEVFLSTKFNCNGKDDLKEFLWADYRKGRWNGEFLSDLLKNATSQHKIPALGFRDYRQVAVAFMEMHLKYKAKDKLGQNAIVDLQAGHSSRTAGIDYAVSTEDHGKVSREAMHLYYLESMEWNELLLCADTQKQKKRSHEITEEAEVERSIEMLTLSRARVADFSSSQPVSLCEIIRPATQDMSPHDQSGMSLEFRN